LKPEPSLTAIENTTRRNFLRNGSTLTATLAASSMVVPSVHSQEPAKEEKQLVRLGLVGAGGRGGGAINDSLTINENVKLVAIADMNSATPATIRGSLMPRYKEKIEVPDKNLYYGLDSYRRMLDNKDVDVVLMTTPPGFRPRYVAEAVDAGKHVFAEKPSCVDPAGYKICLEAHKKAEANGTAIVTGTQYRRQTSFIEVMKRIHDGAIGDIVAATTRYCSNGIWYRGRTEGMSDTEYQIHNWMHFIWLSGDQIVEQAVHNIDAMNWLMGGPPERAYGSGGRFLRPADSEMWDNMQIDYHYPGNRIVTFQCRQIEGIQSMNDSYVYGSNGSATIGAFSRASEIRDKDGKVIWTQDGDINAAYKQEHKDLVDSIRAGKPIVELKQTADSSLTAVMGRMAAYTGQEVSWNFVTEKSTLDLFPNPLKSGDSRPEPAAAIPGKTKLT
jgi:predicted dehydrogenase